MVYILTVGVFDVEGVIDGGHAGASPPISAMCICPKDRG